MDLLVAEVRRNLSRRLVRVLMGLAVAMSALAGVLVFANTDAVDSNRQAKLVDLWMPGTADGILIVPIALLALGALIGGSSVVGAEWRFGTMTTSLGFEPRRVRTGVAKISAAAVVAALIALVLLAVFAVALLPAFLLHGSTAGADSGWWLSVLGATGRALWLVGFCAALGAATALATRNTVVVLVGAFVYLNVVERMAVAWKPWLGHWALSENVGVVLTNARLSGAAEGGSPTPGIAAARLVVYVGVAATVAVWSFRRRDVLGAV